jgi:hypothetical protein
MAVTHQPDIDRRCEESSRATSRLILRWALRDSNPRPSPCKGDALPAELSARSRGMPARPAHDLPQREGQARPAASFAPIQALGPVGAVVLAIRTDQHLHTTRHRSRPRHRALVRVEGGAVAEDAARPVRRPHDREDIPLGALRLVLEAKPGCPRRDRRPSCSPRRRPRRPWSPSCAR